MAMFGLSGQVIAALLSVYVFWGGTYMAGKFAIETMPPTVMAGVRFLLSGILMYGWECTRGLDRTGWPEWRDAAVSGCCMLAFANGSMVWAQQYIPSALSAVVLGMTPLWIVLLGWLWQKEPRPGGPVWTGLLLGFAGVALLAGDAAMGGANNYFLGICISNGSALFWAIGSLYSRKSRQPKRPLQWVAMQMLCAGAALCLIAVPTGQWQQLNLHAISTKSLMGFLYLITCGSFLGYASYVWLLNNTQTSIAATYAYVNPLVAVFVGWLLAGEVLGVREALATGLIVSAVALITRGNRRPAKANH